jgi:hypothetical protein
MLQHEPRRRVTSASGQHHVACPQSSRAQTELPQWPGVTLCFAHECSPRTDPGTPERTHLGTPGFTIAARTDRHLGAFPDPAIEDSPFLAADWVSGDGQSREDTSVEAMAVTALRPRPDTSAS